MQMHHPQRTVEQNIPSMPTGSVIAFVYRASRGDLPEHPSKIALNASVEIGGIPSNLKDPGMNGQGRGTAIGRNRPRDHDLFGSRTQPAIGQCARDDDGLPHRAIRPAAGRPGP